MVEFTKHVVSFNVCVCLKGLTDLQKEVLDEAWYEDIDFGFDFGDTVVLEEEFNDGSFDFIVEMATEDKLRKSEEEPKDINSISDEILCIVREKLGTILKCSEEEVADRSVLRGMTERQASLIDVLSSWRENGGADFVTGRSFSEAIREHRGICSDSHTGDDFIDVSDDFSTDEASKIRFKCMKCDTVFTLPHKDGSMLDLRKEFGVE